jgi:hypothetical protein
MRLTENGLNRNAIVVGLKTKLPGCRKMNEKLNQEYNTEQIISIIKEATPVYRSSQHGLNHVSRSQFCVPVNRLKTARRTLKDDAVIDKTKGGFRKEPPCFCDL